MRRKVVYAVQINDMTGLRLNVTCPNCDQEIYLIEEDDERKCPTLGCEDIRFKIDLDVRVFTGVKQPKADT